MLDALGIEPIAQYPPDQSLAPGLLAGVAVASAGYIAEDPPGAHPSHEAAPPAKGGFKLFGLFGSRKDEENSPRRSSQSAPDALAVDVRAPLPRLALQGSRVQVLAGVVPELDQMDAFTLVTDEGPVLIRARRNGSVAYLKR